MATNLEEFSPKLTYIKKISKQILAEALSLLGKIENLNSRVEPTLNSLSKHFALNTVSKLLWDSNKKKPLIELILLNNFIT